MKTYAIWQAHNVIGYINLTPDQAERLNGIPSIGVYFGYDEKTNPERYINEDE